LHSLNSMLMVLLVSQGQSNMTAIYSWQYLKTRNNKRIGS